MCRLKYIHINLYMYGLTCVPRGPTILMHLAAPKSLMKRTQNRAVNKVTLHINIQYHISPSWTSYHSNIHIHPDIVDLYEE